MDITGDAATVDFSPETLAGLVEDKQLGCIYDQVKATLTPSASIIRSD